MKKSTFHIAKMDCPSEEQMIRMKLSPFPDVSLLKFDIPNRKLEIFHAGDEKDIQNAIHDLDLQEEWLNTVEAIEPLKVEEGKEREVLWWVLAINFSFFIIEITAGWISGSMGLMADSLDMLSDSIVYGLSLLAVGAALSRKNKIAGISGIFQILLAVMGFMEIIRRFLNEGEIPLFSWMIIISLLALGANVISLLLIQKARSKEVHMQASAIFTSNDIIVNSGVIIAGILVYILNSAWPDLVIGAVVFIVVMRGAVRILKLAH